MALIIVVTDILYAQIDTIELRSFEINEHVLERVLPGSQLERLKTNSLLPQYFGGVESVISSRTDLNIRGYSPGSSSSLSIRGSSSSQVQICINGVPFENPSLAQTDLSLLPIGTFKSVEIYRGSAGSILGNSTIGGAVFLSSDANFENKVDQFIGIGSFGTFSSASAFCLSSKNYTSQTNITYNHGKNNFNRNHPITGEKEGIPNAYFESFGLSHTSKWVGEKSLWKLFGWVQHTSRELPPNLLRPSSESFQEDKNYRIQISNETSIGKAKLSATGAIDFGNLRYVDPRSNLDDSSSFNTAHLEIRIERSFSSFDVWGGTNFRTSKAKTENYNIRQERNSPAVFGGIKHSSRNQKTQTSLTFRQELLNGSTLPFIATFGISQKISKAFQISANAGNTYRIPGLNDLFWNPGGNPDLKPESGWFAELGLEYRSENRNIEAQSALFYRNIDNWIQWRPGPEFWSPINIRSVSSYGIETKLSGISSFNNAKLTHSIQATLSITKNNEPAFADDTSDNKQLIYTPPFILAVNETISILESALQFTAVLRYTSLSYVTVDNSNFLDPYFLIDLESVYSPKIRNLKPELYFAVRNLLDTDYQTRQFFSMPGINFEAGIRLQIQTKNRKNEI